MAQRRVVVVGAAVALAALLPFARGLLLGRSLYFRDLSLQFLPLRIFALEGLRAGELRQWNPFTHEGEPLAPPALTYPLDLLQLLRPDQLGISWTLALHVPLAALTFLVDFLAAAAGAKRVGASPWAVVGAAIGTVAGVFTGLVGLLFLPLAGAALGEFLARRDMMRAGKVGVATWVGLLVGTALKVAIVFAMVVKPTADDVWAIVIVAAILVAGSAVFLRGIRETSAPEASATTG